jgi:hypothetical protein
VIPVHQTKSGHGNGNCTAACLASILEMPLENVLDVSDLWFGGQWSLGWEALQEWLGLVGLRIFQERVDGEPAWVPWGYWIATTQEGETLHATVWHGNELVHDPFPRDADGDEPKLGPLVAINYLVVTDPMKLVYGYESWRRGEVPPP